MDHFSFILLLSLVPHLFYFSSSLETLTPTQSLSDGETLVSQERIYELGFFSPDGSMNRFLGIWYKNIPQRTVVWVANRDNPINGSSGNLTLTPSGKLVLLSNSSDTIVWSTNTTSSEPMSSIVQLLRTGNLVLQEGSDLTLGTYLWQSFDYPTDTFLPEMKIGWDLKTRLNRRLVAWKGPSDPSSSDFSWGMEHHSYPESIAWKGNEKYFRSGPWNGLRYSGAPEQKPNALFWFKFVWNEDEVYYTYGLKNKSVLTRNVLNRSTYAWERSTWSEVTQKWMFYSTVPKDKCDNYDFCGPHGNCNMDNLGCQCLQAPNRQTSGLQWIWSQGCKRDKQLKCGGKDGFKKFSDLKLPDTTFTWVNTSLDIKECREKCLRNCSCTAYTHSDISGSGSGCALWFGDLMDIRTFTDSGQDLYIRMAASELGGENINQLKTAVAAVAAVVGVLGIVLTAYYFHRSRKKIKERMEERWEVGHNNEKYRDDMELPAFDLSVIVSATNNFSTTNKLGEGGFGPVYKGTLADGQEIAVKRLSSSSGQGLKEFKNEVILIAKLQHQNLVRLLGCCIQGEEKMLVYEYMPNKSLDAFIFDDKRRYLLDWPTRFNIICRVARGLLYLHQDSRLRIIHRDLKASNVLLDKEMNPKISDFGMAKTFGGDQSEGNTNRVVGTYGYMAPEYAIDGLFSVKSDVFSFGILVLEIVSGKRNRGIFRSNQNLIGQAWRMYSEDRPLELMDPCLENSTDSSSILMEVMRCIHVSFLCLQQQPEERPSMASVAVMLGSDGPLQAPKQPGFLIDYTDGLSEGTTSSSKADQSHSVNQITISLIKGR